MDNLMPRTLQEILDHADELADLFESDDFGKGADPADAWALRDLRRAVQDRAAAEMRLAEAVAVARGSGRSWAAIGAMLGTSGEAARQRYGGHADSGSSSPGEPTPSPSTEVVDLLAALEASVREAKAARAASDDAARRAEEAARVAKSPRSTKTPGPTKAAGTRNTSRTAKPASKASDTTSRRRRVS